MVDVRPFKGIFYNQDLVDLGSVLTLPYDVITDELKQKYCDRSSKSYIKLILPDGEDNLKYVNSRNI